VPPALKNGFQGPGPSNRTTEAGSQSNPLIIDADAEMAVDIKMKETKTEIKTEAQTDRVETGAGVETAIGLNLTSA
jgi:hypothetical protein